MTPTHTHAHTLTPTHTYTHTHTHIVVAIGWCEKFDFIFNLRIFICSKHWKLPLIRGSPIFAPAYHQYGTHRRIFLLFEFLFWKIKNVELSAQHTSVDKTTELLIEEDFWNSTLIHYFFTDLFPSITNTEYLNQTLHSLKFDQKVRNFSFFRFFAFRLNNTLFTPHGLRCRTPTENSELIFREFWFWTHLVKTNALEVLAVADFLHLGAAIPTTITSTRPQRSDSLSNTYFCLLNNYGKIINQLYR